MAGMIEGDAIAAALQGRTITGLALKPYAPFAPADAAAYVQYLDLALDAGPTVRVWRGYAQQAEVLHVLPLTYPPGPDPDGAAPVDVSTEAAWAPLVGARIVAVEREDGWVPRPAPAGPPEPSGDPELDAWRFGPEDWAAWAFADDDPKEAYVLRALALELGAAGRLAVRAVRRPGASDLDPAAALVTRVPGRVPGAAPPPRAP